MGKLNTLAKGSAKNPFPQSGSSGTVYPNPHWYWREGRPFWIITQAETIEAFPRIRDDLAKTADASYVLELVDKVSTEGQPEDILYRLLRSTLDRINQADDTFNAVRYFEFRFLDAAGFRPELIHCVSCKKAIKPEDQFFSPVQGGILCPSCGSLDDKALPASMNTLRYIRHFQRSAYKDITGVVVPEDVRNEMQRLLGGYITVMLDWNLKTPGFYPPDQAIARMN